MLFTLKEHQVDAVRQILDRLRVAKRNYHEDGVLTQFALSATTSAGKTVICAAVVEALFFGSEEFNVDPDPGATVLWFSDDPPLNVQSMARFRQASEKLGVGLTRIIESGFAGEVLEPNTVYFLNAQKLREGARLVRGATPSGQGQGEFDLAAPDMAQQTIYDVIRNTIEAEGRTLYFILDEAHRGMKSTAGRQTIVQRIIGGTAGAPPMPIVFGISATVERFEKAMAGMDDRSRAQNVTVDARQVMESGLLKEQITLDMPDDVGQFDTTMLAEAVEAIKKFTAAWDEYTDSQGLERVYPLMVLQVPDSVGEEYLSQVVQVLTQEWDVLRRDGIGHVFGSHTDLQVGMRTIPYVEPHRVQDEKWVRVLLAKEAISTGWDCPRAEVLVSFRPRTDKDAIHQLFGRMMRPPLARRITGNDLLNSVMCFVPLFDPITATKIAEMLQQGETNPDGTRGDGLQRVLFDPVDLTLNPDLPEGVTAGLEGLPTYTIPSGLGSPMRRLDRLSAALTLDFPGSDVSNGSTAFLVNVLRGAAVRYEDKVAAAKKDVLTMQGRRISARIGETGTESTTYEVPADARAVNDAYQAAARTLSRAVASALAGRLLDEQGEDEDIMDVQATVAALARVTDIVEDLHREAGERARDLTAEYAARIAGLSDDRQAVYQTIEGLSSEPERATLHAPTLWQADRMLRTTNPREGTVTETPLPVWDKHYLATAEDPHVIPARMNAWEEHVLKIEQARAEHVGWYRNPARGDREAVVIPWQDGTGVWRGLRPDFVFFDRRADGTLGASIVDPHGYHLADALPKLRALADYAENHGDAYLRVLSIARTDGVSRSLDMKAPHVRAAVREATDAKALYLDDAVARDYR